MRSGQLSYAPATPGSIAASGIAANGKRTLARYTPAMTTPLSTPLLAIDVGAGTQDILLYDPARAPENCLKLVLPSQTQVVGARVRAATAVRKPLHLQGGVMGGGASSEINSGWG